MNFIPDNLFFRTFFILGTQLFITFVTTKFTLEYFLNLWRNNHPEVSAVQKENGEIDLSFRFEWIRNEFITLLVLNIVVFLILAFWQSAPSAIRFILFSLWSVLTGVLLGLSLIQRDENLGARVLGITSMVTFIAALIGVYSQINFSFLGGILFFVLLGLVFFNFVRLFVAIPQTAQKVASAVGIAVFTLYLVYDFNRLEMLNARGETSWTVAYDLAINIYLDIINLFLDILEYISS